MKLVLVLMFYLFTFTYGADNKKGSPPATKKADPKKYGKNIDWQIDYSEAAKKSHDENKPIFLLIWRTWCNACQALSKQMSKSFDIEKLSKQFVMLSIWDEENEPWFEEFSAKPHVTPHVPRVHFVDPDGKLMTDIACDDPSLDENFTFYYSRAESIAKAMEEVLRLTPKTRERKSAADKPDKEKEDKKDDEKSGDEKKKDKKDKKKAEKKDKAKSEKNKEDGKDKKKKEKKEKTKDSSKGEEKKKDKTEKTKTEKSKDKSKKDKKKDKKEEL